MVRERAFLAIFLALAMVYYALPKLPFLQEGLPQFFSFLWVVFALLAIGGNLVTLLYVEPKRKTVLDLTKEEDERERVYDM